MKTYLDCIPCFFRQVLEGARFSGASLKQQKMVIDELARRLPGVSLDCCPPEIARIGCAILKKLNPRKDPYLKVKQKSNRLALAQLEKLKNRVAHSKDRLLKAVELAIAGNIIDFGAKNNLNVEIELKKILAQEDKLVRNKSIFHYREFKRALKGAEKILILGDNAGETVFDRILIEEIKMLRPEADIFYAVKSGPIINDALPEDAIACGIDKLARIIPNGSDAPGTILSLCSREFIKIYNKADLVISKGQGNFESLSQEKRPVFFLFMVKCPVVAENSGCRMGDMVLLYNLSK
ncbi:MAG: ARMT1-like domain-containing protein [Candidatus Omnitrophica bacterium]|nr:ARMT1-like domain-containing protein [Candidatus Omnitrophota bacterium]